MPPPKSFTEQLRQDPPQGTPALEEAFIMRFPEETAEQIRELIDTNQLAEKLQIRMNSHERFAEVDFLKDEKSSIPKESIHFKGKLVDLPTINEIYKSIDDKNMYKCTDLSQMLVLQKAEEYDELQEEFADPDDAKFDPEDPKQVAAHDKMYQYPHGLIPPFKNIRKKRFRKTAKRMMINATELENDVKKLLREDFDENVVESSYVIEYEDVDMTAVKEKAKYRKWHNFMRNKEKGLPNYGQPGWDGRGTPIEIDQAMEDQIEQSTSLPVNPVLAETSSTLPEPTEQPKLEPALDDMGLDMSDSEDEDLDDNTTTLFKEEEDTDLTTLNSNRRLLLEKLKELENTRELLQSAEYSMDEARERELEDDMKRLEAQIEELNQKVN